MGDVWKGLGLPGEKALDNFKLCCVSNSCLSLEDLKVAKDQAQKVSSEKEDCVGC